LISRELLSYVKTPHSSWNRNDALASPAAPPLPTHTTRRSSFAPLGCRSASGQQKHFKSFASSAGGYKERSIHPCDDYCAVPLPVLHRAADQLQRYLADGLAV
jgi:hypothetical protein